MNRVSREIAFPFHIGHDGGVAFVSDPYRAAFQHIIVVLLTQPGERVMLPEFGAPTGEYLFENLDESLAAEVSLRISQALSRWEGGVKIHDVSPRLDSLSEGALIVEINFSVPPRQDVLSTTIDVGGALNGESSG